MYVGIAASPQSQVVEAAIKPFTDSNLSSTEVRMRENFLIFNAKAAIIVGS
jgi:hypothetical protein